MIPKERRDGRVLRGLRLFRKWRHCRHGSCDSVLSALRAMTALRPISLVLALAALALLAASGPGVRLDVWTWRTGFVLFAWAAWLGIAAAATAIVALALPRTRGAGMFVPLLSLVLGVAVFGVPFQFQRAARAVPPINDITTDTEHPPQFMRGEKPYPGAEFARQQRAAYPDLTGVTLPLPPREAFARVLATAEAMGWEVVGRDAQAGRLEAVDTTPWFGFKDDIAIRVAPAGGGSRVDVRSKSRVGLSDLGTNARRIRAYLQRLQAFGGTLRGVEGRPQTQTRESQ